MPDTKLAVRKNIKSLKIIIAIIFLSTNVFITSAQKVVTVRGIVSGVSWFDQNGDPVSAHGANIIKDNGKYYLFGEKHYDDNPAFAGFNCYSSDDLYNWKFESTALPVQKSGKLGPNRIGERPKVLKCPKTGEYIMLMHADTLTYKDQFTGYATAKKITGPYEFKGPILFNGKPIRKWDMGTFQDDDGSAYLIIHSGLLYKLSDDYKSIAEEVVDNKWHGSESPTIFKKEGVYFWLASDLTSWERNDNFYYTAASLKGPWTYGGNVAPKGTLTWNSQCSFVLPVTGTQQTTYMYMGDRWSFPYQASAATYVWQPLHVNNTVLSIPEYQEAWQLDTKTGIATELKITGKTLNNEDKSIAYKGEWKTTDGEFASARSNSKGDNFSVKFTGTQIGFYGIANPVGGYADVVVTDSKGKAVASAIVDAYSKYEVKSLLFLTPLLKKGNYILTVTVRGHHSKWSDKRKSNYGSTDDFISLHSIIIKE
ncbi:family 43 glycosylhydrolase [Flavobacterium sp. Sd200]|uniref:family 43 glycosylhydrolase n=1 Tax=Flavobacterium sp. Sd200 TaxID=2692211 RepID=UPI00136C604D|nr:family 43 glycosylhydrolase [Flavobacterium sp. Sd200]MXN90830.1 family 43 glycosylhydrolase [Flavobacterium sp. Sd200]